MVLFLLGFSFYFLARLEALVFFSSGSVNFNTLAPTGVLSGSGWQFQGRWRSFLGTPVAPSFFITAKHVGGDVGDVFSWNGTNYTTVGKVDHPMADLTLWRIGGRFPTFAPLYTQGNEVGRALVVFGRSAARGPEFRVPSASPTQLRGWQWGGSGAGTMRWGQNEVDRVITLSGAQYLMVGFNRSGGVNEATLASGDSGGAVFIKDGMTWKLAGINYGVEADFSTNAAGTTIKAAVFDAGNTFHGAVPGKRVFIPDQSADVSASWVATRISVYSQWIRATAGLP